MPMWKVLPADLVTLIDVRLRASAADSSTILAARSVGFDSTTRPAAIGLSGVQPFGASLQPIVFHDPRFATSSTAEPANSDIVSLPPAGSGEGVAVVAPVEVVSPSPLATSELPLFHHFTWLPTASTAADTAATHSTPVTRRRRLIRRKARRPRATSSSMSAGGSPSAA